MSLLRQFLWSPLPLHQGNANFGNCLLLLPKQSHSMAILSPKFATWFKKVDLLWRLQFLKNSCREFSSTVICDCDKQTWRECYWITYLWGHLLVIGLLTSGTRTMALFHSFTVLTQSTSWAFYQLFGLGVTQMKSTRPCDGALSIFCKKYSWSCHNEFTCLSILSLVRQEGILRLYCQVVNYLLTKNTTDIITAKASTDISNFKPPANQSAVEYVQALWTKFLRWVPVCVG